MVPQVEDDQLTKCWRQNQWKSGGNHVFICIMKIIGCHGIEGHQKIAWHMFN